jgi:hypothetical protein
MENETSKYINNKNNVKYIYKYKIKEESYNISSSLDIDFQLQNIKDLYYKRWKAETFFDKIKHDIIVKNEFKSKKLNTLLVDFECIHLVSIITAVIVSTSNSIDKNHKCNETSIIDIIFLDMLNLLLKEKRTNTEKKEIFSIIRILIGCIIPIINNRHYPRKRKRPATHWNRYGNKYGTYKTNNEIT